MLDCPVRSQGLGYLPKLQFWRETVRLRQRLAQFPDPIRDPRFHGGRHANFEL